MTKEIQKTDLVIIENNNPVVSSLILAEGFQITHKALIRLIRKYEPIFQKRRAFEFSKRESSGGRQEIFCKLDEDQTIFLITLLRNSEVSVPFKDRLASEFSRMKRTLSAMASQKQNAEWLEKRASGKIARRQETDTIKKFVDYAKAQGSQSAEMYYTNISKMQNQALFLLEQKYPNVRDILNLNQLSTMEDADAIVSKALEDGMVQNLGYKDIYKLAKSRIEIFSEIRGKTLIPAFQIQKQLTAA